MSDSVRPHRWQPTRLWDSPGKNTGVGCRFLLQCMKVKSKSEVTQSCLILEWIKQQDGTMCCKKPTWIKKHRLKVNRWRKIYCVNSFYMYLVTMQNNHTHRKKKKLQELDLNPNSISLGLFTYKKKWTIPNSIRCFYILKAIWNIVKCCYKRKSILVKRCQSSPVIHLLL